MQFAGRLLYNKDYSDKKFTREQLIRAGFEFGFLTHIAMTVRTKSEITFCYDYGYREVTEGNFQIYPTFSQVYVKNGYKVKVD